MGKIGCLLLIPFIIFILGFLFGFSFLRRIFVSIFGTGSKTNKTSSNKNKTKQNNTSQSIKKIITREEGEYVDFVEIKD